MAPRTPKATETDAELPPEAAADGDESRADAAAPGEVGRAAKDDADLSPEELRRQRDEFEALWHRAQADYQNARRRGLADQEALLRRNLQPLLEGCLLVLDHLDMALACPTTTEESQNLALGVKLTRDQLVQLLERNEVLPVAEEGLFDPNLHQAIDTVEDSGLEPGSIVETLRRGYLWRGTVLRFAQVRVAAGREPDAPAGTEAEAEPDDRPAQPRD